MEIKQECMWIEDHGSCSDFSQVQTKSDLLTLYETNEEGILKGAFLDSEQVTLKKEPWKWEHEDIHSETCTTSELKVEDHKDEIEIKEEYPDLLINLVEKREIKEENTKHTFHDRFRDVQKQEKRHDQKHECIVYPCTLCSDSYLTKRSLALHMEVHKGTAFPCKDSNLPFSNVVYLQKHQKCCRSRNHLPNMVPQEEYVSNNVVAGQSVSAKRDLCKETFKHSHLGKRDSEFGNFTQSDAELQTHTGERRLTCTECGKMFACSSSLHQHLERSFTCTECGKMFACSSSLHQHLERSFTCTECGKTFSRYGNLKAHLLTHTGEKPFTCTECGKTFVSPIDWQEHTRKHSGEKLHRCHECGKMFTQSYSLHRHLRIHSGERPFSCTECGKKFIESSALQNHLRTHTGEKPYACTECKRKFTQKTHLNEHSRTHTGIETIQLS